MATSKPTPALEGQYAGPRFIESVQPCIKALTFLGKTPTTSSDTQAAEFREKKKNLDSDYGQLPALNEQLQHKSESKSYSEVEYGSENEHEIDDEEDYRASSGYDEKEEEYEDDSDEEQCEESDGDEDSTDYEESDEDVRNYYANTLYILQSWMVSGRYRRSKDWRRRHRPHNLDQVRQELAPAQLGLAIVGSGHDHEVRENRVTTSVSKPKTRTTFSIFRSALDTNLFRCIDECSRTIEKPIL
ncbi:hypothetical protein MVEG_07082 [Podila verticillata NRRL 6337]|nr:hypothetical protein MVEG_07082 [Podila verticillata NRRL 6337]